ncbi:hypothetical protein ACFQJC_14140 [Haloferax namakaokahaiae]|uniref:Uncharacterized protein n=1 Tax=Haloferax namakaokahaiae TaxID=1748331 RepID=A0ABD5ZIA9_9EURY
MARDRSFGSFLEEVAMRLGAAVVVVGVFFGVSYLSRADVLGLSPILGTQSAFFAAALFGVAVVAAGWISVQQLRS